MEIEADDWTEDWGFDPGSIDDWAHSTGIVPVLEVSLDERVEHMMRFGR
jgi:hypothetical protein